MIPTIYISEYLEKTDRGKSVVKQLKNYASENYYDLRSIPFNKNEWCRDYMPVLSSVGEAVLFSYKPKYLLSSKSGLASIPNQKKICKELNLKYKDCSDIVLDGGAIDIHNTKGFISDRFIQQNISVDNVKLKIQDALALDELNVIPADPWDFTSHVDGLVRFIDDMNVIVNDYTEIEKQIATSSKYIRDKYTGWKYAFDKVLLDTGCTIHKLVSCVHNNLTSTSAKGIYLNFLLQDNFIIMPTFKDFEVENQQALKKLEQLYKRKVLPIEADKLAEHGGIINCAAWTGI
ncbi:MAG TPA: agmatine deiminase family protein [Segetibacter sp.]|jgi:agmatine deiminase